MSSVNNRLAAIENIVTNELPVIRQLLQGGNSGVTISSGTEMSATAQQGDLFYRPDLGILCAYQEETYPSGGLWVSSHYAHFQGFRPTALIMPIVTPQRALIIPTLLYFEIFITEIVVDFFAAAPNDADNYWNISIANIDEPGWSYGASATYIDGIYGADQWHMIGTNPKRRNKNKYLEVYVDRVGYPGQIQVNCTVQGRFIINENV